MSWNKYHEVVTPEVVILCQKLWREDAGDRGRLIYLLIYSNKSAYLQLITVLAYGNSPPKSHEKGYLNQTISKNLEKYVKMNSFLEPAALLKMDFYRSIFQRFCLKVSEDFFYRAPPRIFVAIVNRSCTVFLRWSRIMLTRRSIIKSF